MTNFNFETRIEKCEGCWTKEVATAEIKLGKKTGEIKIITIENNQNATVFVKLDKKILSFKADKRISANEMAKSAYLRITKAA